jgi:hypothetical protein
MNLDAADPDCLRVVAPGRGNTLLRVVNSVDLALHRYSRQFADGAPATAAHIQHGKSQLDSSVRQAR